MQSLKLNVNKKLSLFDTYVGSIANYECEIWEVALSKGYRESSFRFLYIST